MAQLSIPTPPSIDKESALQPTQHITSTDMMDDQKQNIPQLRTHVLPAVIPPALELLTGAVNGVDSRVSSLPFEEEEVESGHIMVPVHNVPVHPAVHPVQHLTDTQVLPPTVQSTSITDIATTNTHTHSCSHTCDHVHSHGDHHHGEHLSNNDPDSATFDPLSYNLAPNGRLMEDKEEWERRPKMTINSNGEMVFRPLRMQCTHCDEAYTKTHDLYAHIRTHQRHTECPHCGKVLTCMATFVYHVRTHTMEKPYYCPCDGCDFKNAVKYNLKVHLACIRHGGKSNLAKYAKVLDLDVCDKSLRKRKDNSVHELGSRRSKKRRKMNHGSSSRSDRSSGRGHTHHGGINDMNVGINAMNPLDWSMQGLGGAHSMYGGMAPNGMAGGYYGQTPEEYDQFAAQLLFSLSAYQNAANSMNPQMYDPNAMKMDWTQNVSALNQMNPMMDQQQQAVVDENGNMVNAVDAVKGEQQQLMFAMNGMPNGMNPEYMVQLKPEQMYDPNYGYYGYPATTNQMNVTVDPNQMTALNVNVDPAGYPTKQLTSKDSTNSKVSIGTMSTATPKEIDAMKAVNEEEEDQSKQNGQNENEQKDGQNHDGQKTETEKNEDGDLQHHQKTTANQQDQDAPIVPKQEPIQQQADPMYSGYDQMMQNPVMLMQQDPNAMNQMMMMQQQPQYDQQAMATQYMMASQAYYPQTAANGYYGQQMMYGDAQAAANLQQMQMAMQMQMNLQEQQETEKKIEVPPLPTSMQYEAGQME